MLLFCESYISSDVTSKLTSLPHHNTHHLAVSRTLDLMFFLLQCIIRYFTLHCSSCTCSCDRWLWQNWSQY